MDNRALHKLLDHTDEKMRIWDIHRLYGWLLKRGGQVVSVEETIPNEYKITVSIKKQGTAGICGNDMAEVTWYDTRYIVLKPSIKFV